jgi:hypothetical protein
VIGRSELLLSAVGNGSIRLDSVERLGGGGLGDEIDFGGAEVEPVEGLRLEWVVDGQDKRIVWEVLMP